MQQPRVVLMTHAYLSQKPHDFKRMTGLTPHNFEVVYSFIGGDEVCSHLKYKYNQSTPRRKRTVYNNHLSLRDRLLLTLMRLKIGLGVEDLFFFFGVSSTAAADIFYVWIQLLHVQFSRLKPEMFTTRQAQQCHLPKCLKPFKNYRTTLDSTEVRIQVSYHHRQQSNTYSKYKAGNVLNYLIGINCWGGASFVSGGFEGSISDIDLFLQSKIMDYLMPGDLLLVDRGFTVEQFTDPLGVKVVYPPFLGDRESLSAAEEVLTKKIAAGRVHVERFIRKMKCFRLLKRITNNMLPVVDQCVFVAACLANFDQPTF